MPDKETMKRARADKRKGLSASSQAGEFVREEIDHIRAGKHGARSAKQAIAIGLSKARRAGVALKTPAKGKTSSKTRKNAAAASRAGRKGGRHAVSRTRSQATLKALRREGTSAASPAALSRHARSSAAQRGPVARSRSAKKGADPRREIASK